MADIDESESITD